MITTKSFFHDGKRLDVTEDGKGGFVSGHIAPTNDGQDLQIRSALVSETDIFEAFVGILDKKAQEPSGEEK